MRSQFAPILALLAMTAAAQTPAGEAPQPVQAFEETIDVQAVNLEAVVTDDRGKRVTGLIVEDFRLFVDGVETPITYFSQIQDERQRVPGKIASDAGGTPAAEPSWQSRNILVFLDEATMVKARRDFVVRSLSKQLGNLTAGDQMAVVAFTGSGLEVLCEWTEDRARLASVLAAIQRRPAGGVHMEVARREEMSDASFMNISASQSVYDRNPGGNPHTDRVAGTLPSSPAGELEIEEENFSTARWQRPPKLQPTQLFNPLDQYLQVGEAAAGAMRGLPAPPGRKMMMLLTEGFQDPVFARPVVQEAGRLGYSLYPVDVKGLDTFRAQNDVEFATPQSFRLITTNIDRGIDYTLASMAEATGGKASLNSNRVVALERLVEDSASYYVVGFSPVWRGDDRRHRIRLTVTRPGLKVRTRESYVDTAHRTKLSLEADTSLLLGRSRAEQRLIVTVEEIVPTLTGKMVAISLGVPVESLAFAPREKGFRAEAPFAMVVVNDRGDRKNLQEAWLAVDVEQLPLEGTYARFRYMIVPGSRAERLVVSVHDALTGEALWGEAWLEPREKARKKR